RYVELVRGCATSGVQRNGPAVSPDGRGEAVVFRGALLSAAALRVDNAPMHYQHRFHAGYFADVFKHVLLTGLFRALNRKDKAWCYLDTHAGAGGYDFSDEATGRTDEYRNGIARLWNAPTPPEMVADFLGRVRALNPDGELRHYPGSPLLATSFARAHDRLLLCERVPEIAELLRQHVGGDARAH